MPSFSDETIEDWRLERVLSTKVDDNLSEDQLKSQLKIANDDIDNVRTMLTSALSDVELHELSLERLDEKKQNILKLIKSNQISDRK